MLILNFIPAPSYNKPPVKIPIAIYEHTVRPQDILRSALKAIAMQRLRTGLTLLAMGIGVVSVVVLTALADSARHYVVGEFASLVQVHATFFAIACLRCSTYLHVK